MEKETLTRFEHQCIQEEPPLCAAACPFHLDVKAFLAHMETRAFDRAFKVLEKCLPLPEVLARICDHPCEDACIRGAIDKAIAIGDLERVCVTNRSRQKKYFPAPPKDKTVGIWGSGPSSLAAAWDLSLKGYRVTVFDSCSEPGGQLKRLSDQVLPPGVLEKEIRRMQGFGVRFCPDTAFPSFEARRDEFDAVFLGFDGDAPPERPTVDPFTLRTEDHKLFAGGFSEKGLTGTETASPVWFTFQGRKAATSMDRMLSKVSMAAGRDREGPFETRLDTDVSRIVPAPRICLSPPYDTDLAAQEAGRCHQCDCSRCIRACNSYIESFGGFPGRYAREVYNNLSIVMGERKANLMINSCTFCDLCKTVCPNDFSMADLCLAARQEMVDRDRMPPSAHEFALAEMAHAMGESAFARHAPGWTGSRILFFPGCQLIGSAPAQTARALEWLRDAISPATGLVAGCCGAPAFWAGRKDLFGRSLAAFETLWSSWGQPEVVTACTSCSRMLEGVLPKEKITSLYRKMAETPPSPVPDPGLSEPAAVTDPCTAREDTAVQAAVRTLAETAGITVRELAASGHLTECCGFGGLTFNANPGLAQKIVRTRADQSSHDYIAYCAMCRDRLARAGKRTVHVLDLFWPETGDPASRPDPGFSGRRMNRVMFKADLLGREPSGDPGREEGLTAPSGRKIQVPEAVLQQMEEQFILLSDVRQVLAWFETSDLPSFVRSGRGTRIVSYRAGTVCFWVEFRMEADSYRVVDAWCHRMTVPESKDFTPGKPSEDHDPSVRCAGCKGGLAFFKNHVEYLGSRFDVDLPQCPACGAVYISPELSRTRMAEVEQILEDK